MKKTGMSLILAFMLVVSLVSCGSKDIAKGTWKLTKGYSGETEVTAEQLKTFGLDEMTFTFEDGKVTIKADSSSETSDGTYTVDGNKVTISSEGADDVEGTIDGDELTIEEENGGTSMKLILERQ